MAEIEELLPRWNFLKQNQKENGTSIYSAYVTYSFLDKNSLMSEGKGYIKIYWSELSLLRELWNLIQLC